MFITRLYLIVAVPHRVEHTLPTREAVVNEVRSNLESVGIELTPNLNLFQISEDEEEAIVEALRYYLQRWPNEDNRPAMESVFQKLAKES